MCVCVTEVAALFMTSVTHSSSPMRAGSQTQHIPPPLEEEPVFDVLSGPLSLYPSESHPSFDTAVLGHPPRKWAPLPGRWDARTPGQSRSRHTTPYVSTQTPHIHEAAHRSTIIHFKISFSIDPVLSLKCLEMIERQVIFTSAFRGICCFG